MSARKRGRKGSCASKNSGAPLKKARDKLARFLVDMEVPLNEALDAAHALRFIGYGLTENGLQARRPRHHFTRLDRLLSTRNARGDLREDGGR